VRCAGSGCESVPKRNCGEELGIGHHGSDIRTGALENADRNLVQRNAVAGVYTGRRVLACHELPSYALT
jgi:hypothetical protein